MLPKFIRPMLAVQAQVPFDSDDHLFEIKRDGIRCLAFIEARRVRLQSRELMDITAQFPELSGLADMSNGTVLDGELIFLEQGIPSLAKIQQRLQVQNRNRINLLSGLSPVVFVAFDLLYSAGISLMGEPLFSRRSQLEGMLREFRAAPVALSETILSQGRDLFAAARKLGQEGIMAKALNSHYAPGKRTIFWKKIKVEPQRRRGSV
jgi:bifunctional non-homologous end joining protein LigD